MALRTGILLLIELCVLIYMVKSCAVSCSTDYETLLNCSCSGWEPAEKLLLQVNCRLDDLSLPNASCPVSAQQPFCVMYPEDMYEIADSETVCSAIAFRAQDHTMITKTSDWHLRLTVRPRAPVNVSVQMTKTSYNITWANENPQLCLCLTFKVRIKTCHSTDKSQIIVESKQSFVHLERSKLLPGDCHRVDVQARVCPESICEGNWSEWSTAAVVHSTQSTGTKHYYWLITLPILMIFLSLGFPKLVLCQKKFKGMMYIPDPGEFFKPLYNNYQGNFKAWVKPAFAEHNSLMDTGTDMKLVDWNQSSLSPDTSIVSGYKQSALFVSISTLTFASHSSVTSSCSHESSSKPGELESYPQKRPSLNLSTLNIAHDLDEEELSGSDYPLMDLDTIDSGFGECSSPPVTRQLLCQHYQSNSEPSTEHHSNYVKQWTEGQAGDNSL